MKLMNKLFGTLFFFALLFGIIAYTDQLLEQKESSFYLKPFLERAEEYDVLFLGDSQMLNSVLPMELYNKYGIAAYNLGSNSSRIPMTYWRMMNALDYMTPKLVVLAISDGDKPELTHPSSEWLHVALDGFPMSLTKARAILDLTAQSGSDSNGVPFSTVRNELFFPLLKYHSRWRSLTEEDIHPVYNTQKGANPLVHVSDPRPDSALVSPDECLPEEGYGYAYLRRIIEACQLREIPIVLCQPPYPIRPEIHKGTHTSAKIAEEYGVPLLNFTDMDRVADYYTDCGDPGTHLNASGAQKTTDYLGDYLTKHYVLPDRRGDAAYAHWDDEWNAYVDNKLRVIKEDADSLRSRLMLLHDDSFHVILAVRANFDYAHRNTKAALQNIGRPNVFEDDDLISGQLNPLEGLEDAADFNKGYMMIIDRDAPSEYESFYEFYGIGEKEYETSFGYVFCRMDGEWIDLSITQDDVETYYFDSWEDQEQDMRLILIDRRTGKPALALAFSRTEEEQP